jgi:hypothetical protein
MYSMSSDLKTRMIVWTMNNGSSDHPIGCPAYAIAGQNASLWHAEAISKLPTFEDPDHG